MRTAYLAGHASAPECRVATALSIDPELSGLRAVERASGLCDDTILKILPAEGSSSALLECSSRGVFTWEAEDRRPMQIGLRTSVEHKNPSLSSNPSKVQDSPNPVGDEDLESPYDRRMSGVLDPSLDIWANTDGGLGDHGWILALVTGMRPVTFGLDELESILRLSGRQVRRVLDKMGRWVRRVREGRKVSVTVDFSAMVENEELAELYRTTSRRDRKARLHTYEADAVSEMATQEGRTAREMWRDRIDEARRIREYLKVIPARLHYRLERLLKILETPAKRLSRWEGERALRGLMT